MEATATNTPNYTAELTQLLKFAGDTATAIRMYSHYTGGEPRSHGQYRDQAMAPVDLMFLSDAITQLLNVGGAIEDGDSTRILSVCREVRSLFESYASDNPKFDPQAKPTFDFWAGLVDLGIAVQALNGIESKAAGGDLLSRARDAEPSHTTIQAPTRTGMSLGLGLCDLVDIHFPVALRKMWSGSEVQDWLDRLPRKHAAPQVSDLQIAAYQLPNGAQIERCRQADGAPDKWAVRRHGGCLNREGQYEYEPMPSSRDEAFLARCRFASVDDAYSTWKSTQPASLQAEDL